MATYLRIAAAAAELGYIGESKGKPVVAVEYAAELVGAALGKHPRLNEAGPVECQPAGVLAAAEAAWHWRKHGQRPSMITHFC